MVRAKFAVGLKLEGETTVWDAEKKQSVPVPASSITMYAVYGGSPENEAFFRSTPQGEIRLFTVNPEAAAEFESGTEYYVTFEKAPKPAAG